MTDSLDVEDALDPLHVQRFIGHAARCLSKIPLMDQRHWIGLFMDGVQFAIEKEVSKKSFADFLDWHDETNPPPHTGDGL